MSKLEETSKEELLDLIEGLYYYLDGWVWVYDDNPPSSCCRGCGEDGRKNGYIHKEGCELEDIMNKAQALIYA